MSFSDEDIEIWHRQHGTSLEEKFTHLKPGPNPPSGNGSTRPRQPRTPSEHAADIEEHDRKVADIKSRHQQDQQAALEGVPLRPHAQADFELVMMLMEQSNPRKTKGSQRAGRQMPMRPENIRVVEWYASKGPDVRPSNDGKGDDDGEWASILRDLRAQPGCDALVSGSRDNNEMSVVAIEWANADMMNNFQATERSEQFLFAAANRGLTRVFEIKLLGAYWKSPIALHDTPGTEFYEVCTAYFPAPLSPVAITKIEWIDAPFDIPRERLGANGVFNGALSRRRGWAEGEEVEFRGQAAHRMVYIFRWESKQAKERYHSEVLWPTRTRDGRALLKAMDSFIYELENQGMLGFETQEFLMHGIQEFSGEA